MRIVDIVFSVRYKRAHAHGMYCISIGHTKLCIAFIYHLHKIIISDLTLSPLFAFFYLGSFDGVSDAFESHTQQKRNASLKVDDDLFITRMIEELFFYMLPCIIDRNYYLLTNIWMI